MPVYAPTLPIIKHAWQSALGGARRWPLALALYVPSLILGLVSAIPVFLAADAFSRLGPWTAKIAGGDVTNVLMEMSAAASGQQPPEVGQALAGLAQGIVLLALAVLAQGLIYNVLAGGVLERLAGRGNRSFWGGCRRWAWPMIWFGLLAFLLLVLLGGAGLLLVMLIPIGGSAFWIAKPALAIAWLASLNGWLELARADMVVRDDPRALCSLGRAFALPARPGLFLRLVAVWLVLGIAGVVYTLVSGNVVLSIPVGVPVVALAVQQIGAFGGGWLKLLHLAIALGLAQAARAPAAA